MGVLAFDDKFPLYAIAATLRRDTTMKNIYVGNLDFATTEQDLRGLFETYGTVENVSVVKDKFTGQPRGFGFVEMTNNTDAERAISELNGRQVGNRNLTVNEAKPREARPMRGGSGGSGSYGGDRSGGYGGKRAGGGGGRGGKRGGGGRDRGGNRGW
jgi:RNA recognition motif-containing protein